MPRDVVLRDGAAVRIRALRPSDKPAIAAAFDRLSDRSRYRRFFSSKPRLTAGDLDYLVDVDQHDHVALVAFEPASGEGLGVARFVRRHDDPEAAEVAVAVIDDWQRRGVGRALLERLTDRARAEGIRRFTGAVLAENREALALIASLGQTERHRIGAEIELVVELPDEHGDVGDDLNLLLRGVAASALSWRRGLAERARELYGGRARQDRD